MIIIPAGKRLVNLHIQNNSVYFVSYCSARSASSKDR